MVEKRQIGDSGIEIAPLALGGNVFGWTADEATSFAVLDAFVDAGGTMIDTADVYSAWVPGHQGGESETVIGRYAVMTDEQGVKHVLFWPHREWDGVDGSNRCRTHTKIAQKWLRLF